MWRLPLRSRGSAWTINSWWGGQPIVFTSQFWNSCEERSGVNELELLGVVWSIEYFKYYLYSKDFTVITDHRALLSILKESRSNKSYNSHLTRWIDRLLPFQFDNKHFSGAKMGLVDYIFRHPNQKAEKICLTWRIYCGKIKTYLCIS